MTARVPAAAGRRRFTIIDPVIMAEAALDSLPPDREVGTGDGRHPDALLLTACRRFVRLARRRLTLFIDGEPRHGADAQARLLRPIDTVMAPLSAYVCDCRAGTLDGHRARAAAFLAIDETGLLVRANLRDAFGEPLLAAFVIDLLGPQTLTSSGRPGVVSAAGHPSIPDTTIPAAPGGGDPVTRPLSRPSSSSWNPAKRSSNRLPGLARRCFSMDDPIIVAATSPVRPIDLSAPDAALEADCRAFIESEIIRDCLLQGKLPPPKVSHRRCALLEERSQPLLRRIALVRATTLAGHRARVAAFLVMDGGGLFWRANHLDGCEYRMLAALIADLLQAP